MQRRQRREAMKSQSSHQIAQHLWIQQIQTVLKELNHLRKEVARQIKSANNHHMKLIQHKLQWKNRKVLLTQNVSKPFN